MAFANRGNAHTSPAYVAPGADAKPSQRAKVAPVYFKPTKLTGPRVLDVDGVEYRVPQSALVKVRHPITWINVHGAVHPLTKHGEVLLTDAQEILFSQRWDSI